MENDNGGPAFPQSKYEMGVSATGMSLRDYFATKALQGYWSAEDQALPLGATQQGHREEMCKHFYAWADAMIAASKHRNNKEER